MGWYEAVDIIINKKLYDCTKQCCTETKNSFYRPYKSAVFISPSALRDRILVVIQLYIEKRQLP
jgi:hypothetical protein